MGLSPGRTMALTMVWETAAIGCLTGTSAVRSRSRFQKAHTASILQQALKAGLVDEIHVDVAPILLGRGVRLFDNLGAAPIELENTQTIAAPGVIHLGFHIVK
jgi:hypothetical protein